MSVGTSGGHVLGAALVRLPMRRPPGQASPAVGGIYRTEPGFKVVLEEPPGHRQVTGQCAPKKWQHRVSKSGDDRTGLRHVHDPDRPELLFSRRKHLHSAPLEEGGGPEKWEKSWAKSLPSATHTFFYCHRHQKKKKKKIACFLFSPGNRNLNLEWKVVMWGENAC